MLIGVEHEKVLEPFQGRVSFVDFVLLFVCVFAVILSCLFLATLWSSVGKGLTSWLSCM